MKQCLSRSFLMLCMFTSVLALAPAPAAEAAASQGPAMPPSLQDAFFAATSQEFALHGTGYASEHNGLAYALDPVGLLAHTKGLNWSISLRGIGRGDEVQEVSAPEIAQANGRLEYRRGSLIEWYRDLALGVEQGFTIVEVPAGNGKLVLHLDLKSDVPGVMDADGRGLSFGGGDDGTLRYDHLIAYDANGTALEARLVYTPSQIVIQVDDREAAYPVTIDPLISIEQKVDLDSGHVDDFFGWSVALSEDTALIGAPGIDSNRGAAYVFVKSAGGSQLAAKLTAWDRAEDDYFGTSVALSGDTVLVGAPGENSNQGAAYVFVKPAAGWATTSTYAAKLSASDGAADDRFGDSVAVSGDTALVGAWAHDVGGNSNQGSAYVFVKRAWGWRTTSAFTAKLNASDGGAHDRLGKSVALSADTALVGADGNNGGRGTAYVFVKPLGGWVTGIETARLSASDGAVSDRFGASVALSGHTMLVGAPGDNTNRGSAYVFAKPAGGWGTTSQFTAKLRAWDGAAQESFASSVALSGDTALVGSPWATLQAHYEQGIAYVFIKPGTGWATTSVYSTKLTASDGVASAWFGYSVAVAGDTALVGAPGDEGDHGSVYFYEAYRNDTDLGVAARRSPAIVNIGDTVQLTASVMNHGPMAASQVLLSAPLPSGLTYVGSATARGSYDPSTGSWNLGTLAGGASATLTIQATVSASLGATLTFRVSSLALDRNISNNSAVASIEVARIERLANGGFNTYVGTSKIPSHWNAVNFAPTDGKDATVKREGTASVRMLGEAGKSKILKQPVGMRGAAGNSITFTFWVKTHSVPTTSLCRGQVILYSGATPIKTRTINCPTGTTSGFVKKTSTFAAPGAYSSAKVVFTYSKASGTVWFDGASLMR